jgi:hypothetical protein
MALFAAVFAGGGLLTWIAAFGQEPRAALAGPQAPQPGPLISPSIPDLGVPDFEPPGDSEIPGELPFGDQVQFSSARTEVDPLTGGCSTHIDYIWEIDRGLSPPISGRALIEVNGPGVSGDYHRPVQGNVIRLSLDVDISDGGVFEADVVSVGEVPAFPTPLPASFTDAAC